MCVMHDTCVVCDVCVVCVQGTYVYFDWENNWCARIRRDFKFDYKYLEDELPVAQ